jgi:hypothetical protein
MNDANCVWNVQEYDRWPCGLCNGKVAGETHADPGRWRRKGGDWQKANHMQAAVGTAT